MQNGSGRWVFVITVFVRFAPMQGIYLLKNYTLTFTIIYKIGTASFSQH
jgi:hypothetical protein